LSIFFSFPESIFFLTIPPHAVFDVVVDDEVQLLAVKTVVTHFIYYDKCTEISFDLLDNYLLFF